MRDTIDDDGLVEKGDQFLVANEFTGILVRKVWTRNGERLELANPRTGARTLLDAMQLEIIAMQEPDVFTTLLAGSLARQEDE